MIWGWLANKLAAPLLLAGCMLLAAGLAVQTVRLDGVSAFGLYAVQGYKPMYEAQVAADLQSKLDRAQTRMAEAAVREKALDASNAQLAAQLASLHSAQASYTPTEVIKYVPTAIRTACVPNALLWLLDAAGTGAPASTAAAAAGESGSACSGMDVSAAESAIMQNVRGFPELQQRIANARNAWNAQRAIGQGTGTGQ